MAGGKYGVYQPVLTGDWARLGGALAGLSVRFPKAMNDALLEEAQFYRTKIIEGIREQAPGGQPFKPLSPISLALRKLMGFRGTKALIHTGELRQNVVAQKAGNDAVFAGILYAARGSDGRKLADIGKLNEYGGVVRTTVSKARMRLIAAAMKKHGMTRTPSGSHPGLGIIRIPPRPFIRPVIAMYGGTRGAERYQARVARKLGGLLGVIGHPDLGGKSVASIPERLVGGGRGGGLSKGIRQMRQGALGKKGKLKPKGFGQLVGKRLGLKVPRVKAAASRVRVSRGQRASKASRASKPRAAQKPRAARKPKAAKGKKK